MDSGPSWDSSSTWHEDIESGFIESHGLEQHDKEATSKPWLCCPFTFVVLFEVPPSGMVLPGGFIGLQ